MQDIKILAYHRVCPDCKEAIVVSPRVFEQQILYLLKKKKWQCLGLAELYKNYILPGRGAERKSFVLTFDDGWQDNFQYALPILQKYGLKATIFLPADLIGKPGWLSWQQVLEMQEQGIEFGSHTLSHRDLSKLSAEQARKEIFDSKKILEEKLQKPVLAFCYPFGYFNKETVELIKQAGYKLAVVTPRHSAIKETDFTLLRIGVYAQDNNIRRFKFKMLPFFDVARRLKLFFRG